MLAHLKRAPPQSRQSWYVSARRTYDRVGRKRRECCKANPPHLSPSALSHICNTVWLAEGLTSFKYWLPTYTGFPLHFRKDIWGGKKTSDYINVRGTKSFNQLYPLLTITQATLEISNCKIKCKEMISLYVWHTEVSVNYEIIWDLFPTCIACQACQPWRKKLWPDLEAVQAGIRAVYEGSWQCTGYP